MLGEDWGAGGGSGRVPWVLQGGFGVLEGVLGGGGSWGAGGVSPIILGVSLTFASPPQGCGSAGVPQKKGVPPLAPPPNPLAWFGVLVPPSLRQAQGSFIQGEWGSPKPGRGVPKIWGGIPQNLGGSSKSWGGRCPGVCVYVPKLGHPPAKSHDLVSPLCPCVPHPRPFVTSNVVPGDP